MVWGSDPNVPIRTTSSIHYLTEDVVLIATHFATESGENDLSQAILESGLDNSPMYDSPPVFFDNETTHHMMLW